MKIDGKLLLTTKQMKRLHRGHTICVKRDGSELLLGLKPSNLREKRVMDKITKWQKVLHGIQKEHVGA